MARIGDEEGGKKSAEGETESSDRRVNSLGGVTMSAGHSRRHLLSILGAGIVGGVAGCIDQIEPAENGDGDEPMDTEADDATGETGETDGDEYEDGNENGDESDGENGDENNGDDGNQEDDSARSSLEKAINALVANAERFHSLKADDVYPSPSDSETIRQRLDSATASLDEAESYTSEQLTQQIEAGRNLVEFQRDLNEYYESGLAYNDHFDEAFVHWQTGNFDSAVAELESAIDSLTATRDALESLQSTQESMDHSAIDVAELDYSGEIWGHVSADGWFELDATESLTVGIAEYVRALGEMVTGEQAYESGDYVQAGVLFDTAQETAERSLDTFEGIEANPETPDDVLATATQLRSDIVKTVEALGVFREAAQLAQEGNEGAAGERYEDALEMLP